MTTNRMKAHRSMTDRFDVRHEELMEFHPCCVTRTASDLPDPIATPSAKKAAVKAIEARLINELSEEAIT